MRIDMGKSRMGAPKMPTKEEMAGCVNVTIDLWRCPAQRGKYAYKINNSIWLRVWGRMDAPAMLRRNLGSTRSLFTRPGDNASRSMYTDAKI